MKPTNYEKSILFDVGKWTMDKRIKRVAEKVLEETLCDYRRGYNLCPKAYDAALKTVVLNLIECHSHPICEWVAYSRDRNAYTTGSRYNKLFISYRPLMKVIDAMESHGYVELIKGVYFSDFRRKSRMRPRLKLVQLLYGAKKKPKVTREIELIQLKGVGEQKGKLIEYVDTAETERMRRRVEVINQGIRSTLLGHGLTEEQEIEQIKALRRGLDYSKIQLYRVFNVDFFHGGRFYGPWWQESKKENRQHITIDGCRTVELDYSSFHPRMLYDLDKASIPDGDLYTVRGLEHRRDVCKVLFNSLLNAASRDSAIKAAMSQYNLPRKPPNTIKKSEMSGLADLLCEKHHLIARHLGTGVGIKLQYYDSLIAEGIMMSLLGVGVVCLPVHDSFIVAEHHESLLREVMLEEYKCAFGNYPVISSPAGSGDRLK